MYPNELKAFLDEKVIKYNQEDFIVNDPISIPHLFEKKEDVEIAGFLSAAIAWGRRDQILKKARYWMELMDDSPFDFLMNATSADYQVFEKFYYRTFSSVDCVYFIKALRFVYEKHGGLEEVFSHGYKLGGIKQALIHFRNIFMSFSPEDRTQKHLANVEKGSSAKRLNMFLRWMVRKDNHGVDFGIWSQIRRSDLMLPLDVHTGNISRQLGLLSRKQNDWKALEELMHRLREFDPDDPVKYDFALFGLGVNEDF